MDMLMPMRTDTIHLLQLQLVIPISRPVRVPHRPHLLFDPIHPLDILTIRLHLRVVRLLFIVNPDLYLYLFLGGIGVIPAHQIMNRLYHFRKCSLFDHLWLITHHHLYLINTRHRLINISKCPSHTRFLNLYNKRYVLRPSNSTPTLSMFIPNSPGHLVKTIRIEIEIGRSQRRRRSSGA